MIESLICCEALIHVLYDEALEEFLCFWRVLLERLVVEMEITFDDVADDFEL